MVFKVFWCMEYTVSHSLLDESLLAKAQWFKSLTLQDRMDYLCDFTDLVLENRPSMKELSIAQSTSQRVRVLSAA